jgi:hypothetical protein
MPAADKTWKNIKTLISAEYAKENKQNKLISKHCKSNVIQEKAEATEELIATLTESHSHQMETLIESTTDAMKRHYVPNKGCTKPPPTPTTRQIRRIKRARTKTQKV